MARKIKTCLEVFSDSIDFSLFNYHSRKLSGAALGIDVFTQEYIEKLKKNSTKKKKKKGRKKKEKKKD